MKESLPALFDSSVKPWLQAEPASADGRPAVGEPVNLDFVKKHLCRRRRSNRLTEWLIHLTMRDFFAAASAVMILAGRTHMLLMLFATVVAGWLVVTLAVLRRAARVDAAPARQLGRA